MFQRATTLLLRAAVCLTLLSAGIFGQVVLKEKSAENTNEFYTGEPLVKTSVGSLIRPAEKSKESVDITDHRRFEAGVLFTSLSRDGDGDRNGFGARFTYDFARFGGGKYVAAWDSEINFLPGDRFVLTPRSDGRVLQGFSGLKIGRKWDKFGIFAKARPGFTQYTRGKQIITGTYQNPTFLSERETNFAFDAGGILEFYPTKKITTRFDFGDTMVRFGRQNTTGLDFLNSTITPITLPSRLRHNFQFSAGIGFRF